MKSPFPSVPVEVASTPDRTEARGPISHNSTSSKTDAKPRDEASPAPGKPAEITVRPSAEDTVIAPGVRADHFRAHAPAHDLPVVMRALQMVIEKIQNQPAKPGHVDLEVPTEDGRPILVRLQLRGGEIKTVFRTDSPELRHALEQAWPQFSQRWSERGLQLGDARFEPSLGQQTPQGQDDPRHTPPQPYTFEDPLPHMTKSARRAMAAEIARQAAPATGSLSLWA